MNDQIIPNEQRKVGVPLGIGIFFLPLIFSWFTLRTGYSKAAKTVSFIWLGLTLIFAIASPIPSIPSSSTNGSTQAATSNSQPQAAPLAVVPTPIQAQSQSTPEPQPGPTPKVAQSSPVTNNTQNKVDVDFVSLASKTNELAQGNDRLVGKAERITANESFLTKKFTAMVVPSVAGSAKATFYAKPGTTNIQFVKTTFHGRDQDGVESFIRTTAALVGAAAGTNQREIKPILDLMKQALENGQAGMRVGACELMAVNQNGAVFFVVSFS